MSHFSHIGRPALSARLTLADSPHVVLLVFLPPKQTEGRDATEWLAQMNKMARAKMKIDKD